MDVGASKVEGLLVRFPSLFCSLVFLSLLACSSSLKYEKSGELKKIEEFDQAVEIIKPGTQPAATPAPTETPAATPAPTPAPEVKDSKKPAKKVAAPKVKPVAKKTEKKKEEAKVETPKVPERRQPDIEDAAGFGTSRRPLIDPFRVGEEVLHDVHYFKVSAGTLKFKVEDFAQVNGRKSYTFAIEIATSSLFSSFYSVDDRAETFVDFEDLVPRVYQLHVKETNQLREAKMLFDVEKNTATFWEKKVTKDHGEEEKKQHWEILPYSQNVYSIIYYMRNFAWETGKEYSFRVANDNENLVFSGKALRREVLQTKLGPMKAIVVQPNIVLKGKFKPIGDNFIWLSDDDRKYILRIESKIKIGTLVSEVVSIKPGKP